MERKLLLPIVSGATATGKTAVAIALCGIIDGEIVSADSMQVFRGMSVLSAAPSPGEMRGIKHHMIGMLDPGEAYSAASYGADAAAVITDIAKRKRTPVMCGGTGLYIDAVTRPMNFSEKGDEGFRNELHAIADAPGGREKLHQMLCKIDPQAAERLHKNDVRRVIRAIEIFKLTGVTATEQARIDSERKGSYDELLFALEWPRDALYSRIEERVDEMVRNGLIEEVRKLLESSAEHPTAIQAIGYKEIAEALRGNISINDALDSMKRATRNYAKRQETWLRRDKRTIWIPAQNRAAASIAQDIYERIEVHIYECGQNNNQS